jgi:hypothetical protein
VFLFVHSSSPTFAHLLCCVQIRVNDAGVPQDRHVLLTNFHLYHFHPRKYAAARKCIPLTSVQSISITSDSSECMV